MTRCKVVEFYVNAQEQQPHEQSNMVSLAGSKTSVSAYSLFSPCDGDHGRSASRGTRAVLVQLGEQAPPGWTKVELRLRIGELTART